jgi:hypothetical protein
VALLNVNFAAGVWLLSKRALAENYGWVTLFGFRPAASGSLFLLPWLACGLTLLLPVFVVRVWHRGWWGLPERVFFSLGTLAAIGSIAFLVYAKVLWP